MTILPISDRLEFRHWQTDDLENAMKLWGDPKVMTFIDTRGSLSRDQVRDKLDAEMRCQTELGIQYWPIFAKSTHDFVGCCGLKPWVHSSAGGYELGFHILQEKWGNGYALEAAQAVVGNAKRESRTSHLMAGHHPENKNSRKILLRIGFNFVEDVFFHPTGLMHASYRLAF